MSKFTCLILCVVAASITGNHLTQALGLRDFLRPALDACLLEYDVTEEQITEAAETGNPNIIPPCFNGCVLKKSGFINEDGEYDLAGGMAYLYPVVPTQQQYDAIYAVAAICTSDTTPVTDPDPGCERGGRLSACFLAYKDYIDM